MARYQVATAPADPVRPYLEGVAKGLVDRLYGENGPAWGTKLVAIEDTIKAVRQVLSEKMLDEALQRQANTVEQRPAAWQCCPKCAICASSPNAVSCRARRAPTKSST